ncbi:MAG: AbrB/MazE/SpoVT family DNA-binding domain-containing protein [Pseudomonadota bacterium]|jgi:antitoxin PrlF
MARIVGRKGEVVIPKPIRAWLGIKPGDAMDFALDPDGRVVLTKNSSPSNLRTAPTHSTMAITESM